MAGLLSAAAPLLAERTTLAGLRGQVRLDSAEMRTGGEVFET